MKVLASSLLFASVLAGAPAFAAVPPPYLALGDSIAFGFTPWLDYTQANTDAGEFVGYPEVTAGDAALALTNVACPGETSGSFIDATQPDNGCHSTLPNDAGSPHHASLKVNYAGSQLDYALAYLAAHPDTQLVTINIGGNDLLLVQDHCNHNALCEAIRMPGTVATFTANLTKILARLRVSGYFGQIVLVTQYATNYADPVQLAALGSFKTAAEGVAALFGVTVAHGFEAMAAAGLREGQTDLCKTDLLLHDAQGDCNEHPSAKGARVLADAVLSVLW